LNALADVESGAEGLHFFKRAVFFEPNPDEEGTLPIEVEDGLVKIFGKAARGFEFGLEVENGAAAGGASTGAELGKVF